MKVKLLVLLLLVFLQSCKTKEEIYYMQDINDYDKTLLNFTNPTIQPNDILRIMVGAIVPETAMPYNRTLTNNAQMVNSIQLMQLDGYLVSLDQTITFPVLGEISVAGKTISDLERDLIERLESGGHLMGPSVIVRLLNAKVTVLGEVNNPGTITFTENNINLLQALGQAGDLTINGERRDIVLIRQVDGVHNVVHFDLTKSEWLESPYFILRPNDVIVVNPNGARVKNANFFGNPSSLIAIVSLVVSTVVLINSFN